MKTIRISDFAIAITGVTESDPYYQSLSDGFEQEFAEFCQSHLTDDGIAFDIGANIGITAAILSRRLSQGRVYAFEPAPTAFATLSLNIRTNNLNNVGLYNFGLSDESGRRGFVDWSAWGHITSDPNAPEVDIVTVDSLIDKFKLNRLDLIKIDVEGFEPRVLRGAMKAIRRFDPLIYLEFNSWCLVAYGRQNPVEFIEWLVETFASVEVVGKPSRSEPSLRRLQRSDTLAFVHDNMVHHGCVDDLALTFSEARLCL